MSDSRRGATLIYDSSSSVASAISEGDILIYSCSAPASSPGPTVTVACRCVGIIAWRTQSETRGRAWQKMQKKVYDSTKK